MKTRFIVTLALVCFATYSFAGVAAQLEPAQEKKILKDFIEIYNDSKTPYELSKKLQTLGAQGSDRNAFIFGQNYFKPLPKLSYDLNKRTLSFGTSTLEIVNLETAEAKIDGKPFKYDRGLSLIRNYTNFTAQPPKTSLLESLLMNRAHAAYVIQNERTGKTQIIKWTVGTDGVDEDIKTAGEKFKDSALPVAGIALFPLAGLNYLVTKSHAILSSSCEQQTLDLATMMTKSGISLESVSCQDFIGTGNPTTLRFWTKEKSRLDLRANWTNQEAWSGSEQFFKFDSKKLIEVREGRFFEPYTDKNTGETYSPNYQVKSFKEGSEYFNKMKNTIEPYRQVLEHFGKNESCYKCEAYFQHNLAQSSPKPYDLNTLRKVAGKDVKPQSVAPATGAR